MSYQFLTGREDDFDNIMELAKTLAHTVIDMRRRLRNTKPLAIDEHGQNLNQRDIIVLQNKCLIGILLLSFLKRLD